MDVVASLICAGTSPGSLVHNNVASPSPVFCANVLQLEHLAFQIRDQSDEIVHTSHSVSSQIVITRPYE